MNEQQVRNIIQDELRRSLHIIVDRNIQVLDARNIQVGVTIGMKLGTAATQKIGMYGVTPIVQQAAILNPSGAGAAGVDSPARAAIISVITALKNIGITA